MIFTSFLSPITKRHIERKVLQTHPLHLFRIIQDVDKYAEFLPLCTYSKVNRKLSNGFEATLTVGLPPLFSETYRSRVTVFSQPEQLVVETKSLDGKYFDQLTSRWQLRGLGAQPIRCEVDFLVEITASDPVIVSTLDQVLKKIAGEQVLAFEKRCRQIPLSEELKLAPQ